MNKSLENIPGISFIDGKSLLDVREEMISDFLREYENLTKRSYDLAPANPYRLIIYAASLQIYQAMQYVDAAGKNNLLKYSYGSFLDNIGALRGISRSQGTKARTTIRFSLAEAMSTVVAVPQGTRMGINGIYFATMEYAQVDIGETYVDVLAECVSVGSEANGYAAGEIKTLVDPIAYVDHAANTTMTEGGTDVEDDDSFAERIFYGPSQYSCAGPASAYEYYVRECLANVASVKATSPDDGEVDIRFVLEGGVLPDAQTISKVENYLSDKTIRPLTDHVTVGAPTTVSYNVSITYYISRSESTNVTNIQNAVTQAVNDYVEWQDTTVGMDIVPDELIKLVKEAGAKRVTVTAPVYTAVAATKIAHNGTITITYGGLEDD